MARTEARENRPTWKEFSSQAAALSVNIFNLVSPAPITDVIAGTMALSADAFTGLEVANLTTPERKKKIAAVFQGVGSIAANRGLAMIAVGGAPQHSEILTPGIIVF